MTTTGSAALKFRQCGFCGRMSSIGLEQCPHCHETFPELPQVRKRSRSDGGRLRRGLLYMMLAGVVHYFAAGYSSMPLPVEISPIVTQYMTPALFMLGLAFGVYGVVTRASS